MLCESGIRMSRVRVRVAAHALVYTQSKARVRVVIRPSVGKTLSLSYRPGHVARVAWPAGCVNDRGAYDHAKSRENSQIDFKPFLSFKRRNRGKGRCALTNSLLHYKLLETIFLFEHEKSDEIQNFIMLKEILLKFSNNRVYV